MDRCNPMTFHGYTDFAGLSNRALRKDQGMRQTATFRFDGALRDSFAEFARHRAARLDLGLEILGLDAVSARLRVSGPPDLVDAFEMALSLGPGDCLVLDVQRETNEPKEA